MKIFSLTEISSRYCPIQVEVSFLPGLPQVHFLGRADSHLKESSLRLKSAFRACGFKFPKAQQVIVNLTPSHVKKISPGIELAVAVAILKMTGQGPDWNPQDYIVFGELGLNGEIRFPPVSKFFEKFESHGLLSGPGLEQYSSGFQVQSLSELGEIHKVEKQRVWNIQRPPAPVLKLTQGQADAVLITAVGGHHVLLAGSQGSGKTLMAEVLTHLLEEPDAELLQWHEAVFGKKLSWRPVARPHHTIPPQSMVGGGVPPKPGEITRAHGGLLFLDEMMEFKPATLEVLREALSSQQVNVSRGLQSVTFPSSFQLIGTTNLCPCGKWTPDKTPDCGYNEKRCRSIIHKLSGPLIDRIQGLFYFTAKMEKPQVLLEDLKLRIEKSKNFQKAQGRTHNREFGEEDLNSEEQKVWSEFLETLEVPSVRRRQGWVAWARTLADLEKSERLQKHHFQKAYEQSVVSFEALYEVKTTPLKSLTPCANPAPVSLN